MKKFLILSSLLIGLPLFAKDVNLGKEVFKENCTSCHWHQTDDLFINKKRGFKTKAKLAGMVSQCISVTNVEVFPEDEVEIVNYLNDKFYHLK